MEIHFILFLVYFVNFAGAVQEDGKPEHFECGPKGEYIPVDWQCDGMEDCSTGIDEQNCGSISKCGSHEWLCLDGKLCVDDAMLCNSHNDCMDSSDESSDRCVTYAPYCPMNTMKCGDDQECVSVKKRCDGRKDCANGFDERFCSVSDCDPVEEFACKNGECIHKDWVCDSKSDCADSSDEGKMMCAIRASTLWLTPTPTAKVFKDQCVDGDQPKFLCKTGECINASLVCDSVKTCPDGSDEDGECGHACHFNGGCGHVCTPTPTGPRCSCRPGYELEIETKLCQDINECNNVPPLCSQHCINTPGSFLCSCETGYTLEHNGRFCRTTEGRPDILYVDGTEVKLLKNAGPLKHVAIRAEETYDKITALDYDLKSGNIFYTAEKHNHVDVNGPAGNTTIINGINSCSGLAVDWIGRNIYYIDADLRTINVCGMKAFTTADCYTAVHALEDKPKSLVLDPSVGRMFWCDDGVSPRIERAYMTGQLRQAIVTHDLARPMALTLDMSQRRVYWVDSHLNRIESVDYNGNHRILVLQSEMLHAYGLHVFEDLLYWSGTDGIYQAHKFGSKDVKKLVGLGPSPGVVKAMHKLVQTNVSDLCIRKDPKCSHFCLLTPLAAECFCPNYMRRASPPLSYKCIGMDCLNGGVPIMTTNEITCRCPVGFAGPKCDNKTGVMFTYPLLAKNNYAWVAGVLCVLVLSVASIVFGIYCCRRKRTEKEILSVVKFRQAAAKTQNAMIDPSHRSKSESTQVLVEQSAFENSAYHQDEDENLHGKGTLVVMSSASDESIDSAFLSRQDSIENDLSMRPLTVSENNYESS